MPNKQGANKEEYIIKSPRLAQQYAWIFFVHGHYNTYNNNSKNNNNDNSNSSKDKSLRLWSIKYFHLGVSGTEYPSAKTRDYASNIPLFLKLNVPPFWWKNVCGHLSIVLPSFPQATRLENCLLLRTAYKCPQTIYEHIFGGYCLYIFVPSGGYCQCLLSCKYFVCTCTALKIGDYCLDISSYIPKF